MNDVARKSAQEVEIDHLLAEEFLCDPSFANRFLKACGLPSGDYQTQAAIAEPSLGGEGFGDLLVQGEMAGRRVAILIEDKITAGASPRQAQRYSAYAALMRDQGWDQVWTVLSLLQPTGENVLSTMPVSTWRRWPSFCKHPSRYALLTDAG